MRKLRSFVLSVVILLLIMFSVNMYFENYIKSNLSTSYKLYNDIKNESTFIQKNEADSKNVLMIYGSSELGTTEILSNPIRYFPKKGDDFFVSPIAKGYIQDLAHAIKFACNPNLKGKKVAFIVSLQWFLYKNGIQSSDFQMNFSELQFYEAMKNPNLSQSLKKEICNRIYPLIANNSFYSDAALYAKLYNSNTFLGKLKFSLLKPYFYLKYQALSFSNNVKSYRLLKKYKGIYKLNNSNLSTINLNKDLADEEARGSKLANNNQFDILNSYYNEFIKPNLSKIKNQDKNVKLTDSKEYEDLQTLLKVCKAEEIKPLFILMPVNAKYYDFDGINKTTRTAFFNKTKNLISSYGFDVVDFQKHEYEKYLMEDGMHLGWKGWLYVDKEIDKYCHK